MIINLQTYVLNIPICGIFKKDIELSGNNRTMMSMVNIVVISMETLRIDRGCSIEKGFITLIRMNTLLSVKLILMDIM